MTRYFFHLYNDEQTSDDTGTELPNLQTAIAGARREARQMAIASIAEHGHLVLSHKVVVADRAGTELATIRFGDVVTVRE